LKSPFKPVSVLLPSPLVNVFEPKEKDVADLDSVDDSKPSPMPMMKPPRPSGRDVSTKTVSGFAVTFGAPSIAFGLSFVSTAIQPIEFTNDEGISLTPSEFSITTTSAVCFTICPTIVLPSFKVTTVTESAALSKAAMALSCATVSSGSNTTDIKHILYSDQTMGTFFDFWIMR
jgi:hypothetical protein